MPDTNKQVIEANNAFYQAFNADNAEAMEGLWSNQHDIVVIHPGWPALYGRESVLSSWRQIIESGNNQNIHCLDVKVCMLGDSALVTCIEEIQQSRLMATNIYVREGDVWKIVHHHAGPLAEHTVHQTNQSLH